MMQFQAIADDMNAGYIQFDDSDDGPASSDEERGGEAESRDNEEDGVRNHFADVANDVEDDLDAELDQLLQQKYESLRRGFDPHTAKVPVASPAEVDEIGNAGDGKALFIDEELTAEAVKQSSMASYNEIYFDSDDESESLSVNENGLRSNRLEAQKMPQKVRKERQVLENDELLYDPDEDDNNMKWVERQRGVFGASTTEVRVNDTSVATAAEMNRQRGMVREAHSDAVLNCAACMTTLCLDCQRHEFHHNQFRAMFVLNCQIDHTEMLQFKEPGEKRRRKVASIGGKGSQPEQIYFPVKCCECDTVVGVYDSDELYHFFNVLATDSIHGDASEPVGLQL